jgi:acyl carrier protein
VFGVPHATLGEVVAAAVVPREGMLSTEGSIIEFARSRLAAFKVPRCVLFTTSIPMGATQKVDRLALARQCASLVQQAPIDVALQRGRASVVENEVARLWEELLQVRDVARDMDFFLAGGDSLRAAELSLAVRQRFSVDVSMRDLMRRGATVRGLAHLIEQSPVITLPARLMPINADGDRRPLFAIPGSDGNPGSFIHFGRLIDPRQPLYGLGSRGFDGRETPLDRVEAIAADHLNAIRAFQPTGPV